MNVIKIQTIIIIILNNESQLQAGFYYALQFLFHIYHCSRFEAKYIKPNHFQF